MTFLAGFTGRSLVGLACAGAFALSSARAAAVSSCGTAGEVGARVSVSYEGSVYYVTTPANYSPTMAYPLILGLHGDEGDPANSVNFFWRDVTGAFIFVAPKAPNVGGSWYAAQPENEVWMDGLIETLKQRYNVDLDKISIWGLSGGAVFTSRYILARQHWLSAAEMNMGGSGRRYVAPAVPGCAIPARFVVSLTDNLRAGALGFYELLTQNAHETVWVDANCDGHCFDRVEAGVVARDWLLAHTLCGRTTAPGCASTAGGAGAGGAGNGGAAGAAGSAGASVTAQGGVGGTSPSGGTTATAGQAAGGASGAPSGGAGGGNAGGGAGRPVSSAGGAAAAGSSPTASGGSSVTSGGTTSGSPSGGASAAAGAAGTSTSTGTIPAVGAEDPACSCRIPGQRGHTASWFSLGFGLTLLAAARRRRFSFWPALQFFRRLRSNSTA